jgi:hypothetical protein
MNLLEKALVANRESKQIEFKQSFDPNSQRDWLEKIVRSVVAMANSGGGIIVFGLDKDGNKVGIDASSVLRLDQATITDKIFSYTRSQFADFEVNAIEKDGASLAAILVGPANLPLVFTKEGAYFVPGEKKQSIAFSKGTVYFRHGAKSEPGDSDDLRHVIELQIQVVRKEWLAGVQIISASPLGSQIKVLPPYVQQSEEPDAIPIRLVNDPSVSAHYRELVTVNPNQTHTFRRNDVVAKLREILPKDININSYDVYAIRKAYKIDENPKYYFKPKFGMAQYSNEFIKWILDHFGQDCEFFVKTRAKITSK